MDFWPVIIGVIAIIILMPYIRCLFKRLVCARKIKRICRKKGYKMHPARSAWFLAGNSKRECDLYIETENQVLAIKLFGVVRKVSMLYFKDGGNYFVRSIFGMAGFGGVLSFPFDSKEKRLPAYNFRFGYRDEWETKSPRTILLINPVPIEIRTMKGKSEAVLSSGEVIYGMEIFSLSRLTEHLENGIW